MADIKINGATPSAFYYGGTAASAVYYGATKLWESASPQTTVVIGGKTYPTVTMPDGREWLAVNLDYAWTGLTVATSDVSLVTTAQAAYYNCDEATYGWNGLKRGLLYNRYAASELQSNKATLCPGWHVASKNDWNALKTAVGANPALSLKSTTGWAGYNGTDDYGFAGYPSGSFTTSGFSNIDSYAAFWTTTLYSGSKYNYFSLSDTSFDLYNGNGSSNNYYSIRLIKDV